MAARSETDEASAVAEVARSHEVTTGSGVIVVVEDDATLLGLVSGMLEQGGYQVFRAGDARVALDLLAEQAGRGSNAELTQQRIAGLGEGF